ncbi:flippase-like domain-containing protein [Candidatus Saccharibacteria bacterium]|nr:flippase-like domain-containing protein [Candidatus Saccharibacteria bacterium]
MSAKKLSPEWRKILLAVLFIALNVGVIAVTATSEFGNSSNAAKLSEIKINWWLLLPAVLCFLVAITAEISKYALMIKRMSSAKNFKEKNGWKLARRTVLLGRYYDNITPAAVGGQPFQIYYMRKNSGLPSGASTSIPMFGMISLQVAFIIIALICFLFGGVAGDYPALIVTAWIGLAFYAFWPIMVAGVSFFPKPTTAFIKWIVKVLAKIKIVKNREKALKKVENEVKEYADSVKMILKTKGLFWQTILLSLIFNLFIAAIPFFVLTAFGGDVNFWSCLGTTIAVMSAVYFVPTPGNAGAAEGTFFVVFSALSSGYVFWAMLVWRFFSYYIYIIIGLVLYFLSYLEKRRKGVDA